MRKLKKFIIKSERNLDLDHKDKLEIFIMKYGKWFIAIALPFMEAFYSPGWFTFEKGIIFLWMLILMMYIFCAFFCIIDLLKLYLWLRKIIYPHKDFCEFLNIWRKDKAPLSKWVSYPLYIISFPIAGMVALSLIIMFTSIIAMNRRPSKYPSDRYRKVIREGILWDSVEYHER